MQPRAKIALLLTVAILCISFSSFPVHAPGESYSFSQSGSRIQETNTQSITFVLNVTTAFTGIPYNFTWTVTDPNGGTASASSQVISTPTFTTSRTYPTDFTTTIRYVGNYTISITQNSPPPSSNPVKTSTFEVGLADAETYQRTQPVSISAQGYQNLENITITTGRTGSAPFFSTTKLANSAGVLSYIWTSIPPYTPLGMYNVTLTGSMTTKIIRDIQSILITSANVTIPQLSITQNSLIDPRQRTFVLFQPIPVLHRPGQVVQQSG